MRFLLPVSIILLMVSCSQAPTPIQNQTQVEEFLDQGGVQYTVVDGGYEWEGIRPIFEYFTTPISVVLREEGDVPPEVADWIRDMPMNIGLDDVVQRGSSTTKHPNGGYITKTAMERRADADGVVWNLQGQEFDLRTELNRLPKETALMFRFTLNGPWIFEQSKSTASKLIPEAAEGIKEMESMIAMSGLPVDDLLTGLNGGITFAMCLNQEETVALPIPGGMEIPQVGLVLMIDDPEGKLHQTLMQFIQAQIPSPMQPIERTTSEVKIHRFLGIPSPIKVIPQLALVNNRLVLTTDDLWMEQIIANVDGETPSPLLAQLEGIEDTRAHQAWVIGDNLGQVTQQVSENVMDAVMAEAEEDIPEELFDGYANILGFYPNVVISHQGETLSTSMMLHDKAMPQGAGGAQSVIVAPAVVGLLAAIAVPSVAKARENAQEAQCINNLRRISAAKDMWAIEYNKASGDPVTWADLEPYIGQRLECPAGGTYTIGNVGEPPVSSVFGPLQR